MSMVNGLSVWEAHGRGSNSAISKSNNRNVIATRKNFIEKGRRAEPIGSKPHSYGLAFSAYTFSWGSQNAISTNSADSVVLMSRAIIMFIISFRVGPNLIDWKSIVLINTKEIGSSSINRNV